MQNTGRYKMENGKEVCDKSFFKQCATISIITNKIVTHGSHTSSTKTCVTFSSSLSSSKRFSKMPVVQNSKRVLALAFDSRRIV